jgi:hypothetical protein
MGRAAAAIATLSSQLNNVKLAAAAAAAAE